MTVTTKGNSFRIFFQLSLVVIIASCNIINPAEPIPTYIKVDSIKVTTNYASEGTASHNIKDVWAYMDDQFIGAYQLPAMFPVIGDAGVHKFLFAPGIYDNGIANTHIIYRLMHGNSMELNLVNGTTVTPPTPEITYFSGVSFAWMEDFEDPTLSLVPIFGDTLLQDNTDVFEGAYSGKIKMDTAHTSFRFEMFEGESIPPTSVTYLEMNYKCNFPFNVGLIGKKSTGDSERQIIVVKSTENNWNKIYIDLGNAVRSLDPSLEYKIYISSALGDATSASFRFDNFKLLHN